MFSDVEAVLESYWGGMLKLGAQTIWEEYDPKMQGIEHYAMYGGKYEKSLCHAWGATPIYLFGRYYLGVYPTSPGYETFTVEPNLGGFSELRGTVPINDATVTVELNPKQLSVMASKAGGTLIWENKSYSLVPNVAFVIER
jgi:alpha-L-rhamnosidase